MRERSAGANRAAGCGVLQRFDRVLVGQGNIASLRRLREDMREVRDGVDGGTMSGRFGRFERGDVLIASQREPVRARALAC